jgi:outer membrane biosynthesis protein TonB
VPDRRSILRLLALAGFLLTVALALWLAELGLLLVIVVMAVALLVAGAIEWLSWRRNVLRPAAASVQPEGEDAGPLDDEAPGSAGDEPVSLEPPLPVPVSPAAPAPPARPEPEPASERPRPAPEPAPAVPEPEPTAPSPPPLRPVPPPPPPPPGGPPPAAAARSVIDLRTRVTAQPRRWNLWDLERRARDEAQQHPLRYEEWSYLFVHLRQFASPDGSLPIEFDGLVRESFGELLEHAG